MISRVLLALLAFCSVASAVDTEGTLFVFAFVRNANPDITNQVLSATVLNRNEQDCKFTLAYRPDFHKSTNPENVTQVVPAQSAIEVEIPSWYGFNYTGNNVQDDVYLTLTGYSTCAVTVLANNYDNVTQQGDTFTVLPSTWGSQSYTFSLPPAIISTDHHYEQVFVLPTTEGTTQVSFVEIGNKKSEFKFSAVYGDSPAVYVGAKTSDSRPRTYHVTSDKPIVIVAGVTCAGQDPNACDHVAYMPHPPPASDCYTYEYYDDDHISYLPVTTQFFTDIPGTCLVGQNITRTLNDGVSSTITIKPQMESPLWTVKTTSANQMGVAFHNGGSNIHIARYFDGTSNNTRGAFIATSPSVTQYHNDYTAFYTRNDNDSLEIYCTVLSCASLTLDGVQIMTKAKKIVTQKVDGASYYLFFINVDKAGFHQLDLDPSKNGVYSFFVSGKNGQYSYGYEGGSNKPTVVLAPQTSPGPSAPTTATPTATVPVVTTPTTAPVVTVTTPTATTTQTTQTTPGSKGTSANTPQPSSPSVSTVTTPNVATQSTQAPVTTTTTPNVVTQSTQTPSVNTVTTPKVVTQSTQVPVTTTTTPVVTNPRTTATTVVTPVVVTTTTTAAPQTVPVVTTTAAQSTSVPVVQTSTPAVVQSSSTAPVVPSSSTVPAVPSSSQAPVVPSSSTVPVVSSSSPAPVVSSSTAVPVQSSTVVQTTKATSPQTSTTTTTTTTTQPSTTTSSSSVISLVFPSLIAVYFAIFH